MEEEGKSGFKNFLWKLGGEQKTPVQATCATPHSLALLSSEQHSSAHHDFSKILIMIIFSRIPCIRKAIRDFASQF